MPFFPTVNESYTSQQVTDTFLGYNHNLKIGDGEMFAETNLSSDNFPLLANRRRRGTVQHLTNPLGVIGKAKLAYIDGSSLYYGEENLTSYLTAAGCSISTSELMLPKQLISMGAYIIIYPDKIYINTENYSDCGRIEAGFTTASGSSVTYSLCKNDGTLYDTPVVSATEPANPTNGMLWIDTSGVKHMLKQYSAYTAMWADIPTVYVRIEYTGIGQQFSQFDGVTIAGASAAGTAIEEQIAALNGSKIIYAKGDDFIVVVGLLDQAYQQTTGTVSVRRVMPDVDYLTEAENRLWGCKYGLVNGQTVNEIYCCALGDFKNWNKFLGLSTDSYVASVGTDGKWTGAVTHLGYPIFFKENVLHKVYISSSGAHQIVDTACRGVQDGCSKSLVVVNETLFFKSRAGVCTYDGSLPVSISDSFGNEKYSDAVAGSFENNYYVSMKDGNGDWHMFVYDSLKRLWHREDNTHVIAFSRCGDDLYYLDAVSGDLMAELGNVGTLEDNVHWRAETGLIGYTTVEQKYVTRFNLRMKLPRGSKADMYMEYDSDGIWHHCGHMEGRGTNTFMLPVRPRRCDHFRLGVEGTGDIRIYSFSKIYEVGSDEHAY